MSFTLNTFSASVIVREYCNLWSLVKKHKILNNASEARIPGLLASLSFLSKLAVKKKVNLWSSWSQELCIHVYDQGPYISHKWNFDNHTKLASGTRQSADLIKLRLIFCFHKRCFDCTITAKPKKYPGLATPEVSLPYPGHSRVWQTYRVWPGQDIFSVLQWIKILPWTKKKRTIPDIFGEKNTVRSCDHAW